MATSGPFCLAWVNANETSFVGAHERNDESVQSWKLEGAEGDFPRLTIKIRNPLIGLLAPGRKTWIWFSLVIDSVATPIFFGQLVAIPSDILGELVTLVFLAKPADYQEQKQSIATALKTMPQFDMVFIDPAKRDDPDTIIEGWAKMFHVGRVSHEVSVSDFLIGEDGEEVFGAEPGDVIHGSVKPVIGQAPKKSVMVSADVGWSQTHKGIVERVVDHPISSYTGDGIVSDWPKPGASLGGGYSVHSSKVNDRWGLQFAQVYSFSNSWTNQSKEHSNGDTLSVSWNVSMPLLAGEQYERAILTYFNQVGIIDPYSIPQTNQPARSEVSWMDVPLWKLHLKMDVRYEANRQRSERVKFTLRADLQDVVTDDDAVQAEIVSLQGADVGLPLIDALNWLSVKGRAVAIGTIIVAEHEDGTISYQIATTAGTSGTSEPDFDELLGETTTDGSVVWTSLGTTLFDVGEIPDWIAGDDTPLGQVIAPRPPLARPYSQLLPPYPEPDAGVVVSLGTVIKASNGSFQECTIAGTTGTVEPDFATTRGDTTDDGTVEWTCLGNVRAGSTAYQICTNAGITGSLRPIFSETVGAVTVDGGVEWTSLGVNGQFIAAPIKSPKRRSYFTTDRGRKSVEYLINLARAKLRMASRAVTVSWECPLERVLAMSCRKNATLVDRRLPGGFARGKVIAYTMEANERGPGVVRGGVTIGCAIGTDAEVILDLGEPDYVEEGYVVRGWQTYSGANTYIVGQEPDVKYSLPHPDSDDDDGLVFPLKRSDIVVQAQATGSTEAEQRAAIIKAFSIEQIPIPGNVTTIEEAMAREEMIIRKNKEGVNAALRDNPRSFTLVLKPVDNGPFDVQLEAVVGRLSIPKMIDLEAPSV